MGKESNLIIVQPLGEVHDSKSLLDPYIQIDPDDKEAGWDFSNGDPELWRFRDRLLKPGGTVLDLGIGAGRLSTFFAIQGMNVVGYDTNPRWLQETATIAKEYGLPIELRQEDFHAADLGKDMYETVLLGQSLVHAPSKEYAHEVLDKAIDALKPSGHLWFRAGGKYDSRINTMMHMAQIGMYETRQISSDVFETMCGCSGSFEVEPVLFMDPVETAAFFASRNMNLVHTQTIPTPDKQNILFGEDWKPYDSVGEVGGMITILAQKRTNS